VSKKPEQFEQSKSAVFKEMGRRSVLARKKKFTKEERSAQARAAVAARHDRQRNAPWFCLLVYPPAYLSKGVARAVRMMQERPVIEFFSQDKAEVIALMNSPQYADKVTDIAEQAWSPKVFTLRRTFIPDAKAAKQALAGGQA
jgi:hypothetical protein